MSLEYVMVDFSNFYTTFKLFGYDWRGFSTRNAHMVHIVNFIPIKNGVYIYPSKNLFIYFNYLVSVTAGGPVCPRGHM